MNLIACVDKNWGIGYIGKLLVHIKEDMKYFKNKTINKVVIMGRKTFESLQKPLILRTNIVLTKNPKIIKEKYSPEKNENLIILNENNFKNEVKKYKTDDIFFIGGQSIYEKFLDYSEYAYITKILKKFKSDTFMVNLDEIENWKIIKEEKIATDIGEIIFTTYKNSCVKNFK